MTVTESRDWFEIREHSSDGTTWQKFFEMRLRQGDAEPGRGADGRYGIVLATRFVNAVEQIASAMGARGPDRPQT